MAFRLGVRLQAALVAAALCASAPVAAQEAASGEKLKAPVVVIVDVNRIQRDSLPGKFIAAQRSKYQQAFTSEFEATRKDLQQAQQDLAKQKAALGQQVFEEKARFFDEQVATFQRRYQGAVRALDKATAKANDELQRAAIEVTSEVAAGLGAGLVLHKQNVFLHDERMEVTDAIIERINKRMPTVNFPTPEIEGDAPSKALVKGKK